MELKLDQDQLKIIERALEARIFKCLNNILLNI